MSDTDPIPTDTGLLALVALGRWVRDDLSPNQGYCLFNLVEPLLDPASGVIVQAAQTKCWLDSNGMVAQQLLIPNTSQGVPYYIRQEIVGAPMEFNEVTLTRALAGRQISDAVLTKDAATITSASANFSSNDVNRFIGSVMFPELTFISSVQSTTAATMSAAATESDSAATMLIDAGFLIADVI